MASPIDYLRDLLAQSATWQGWCGAAGPEQAKEHVYRVAVPGAGAEIGEKRPFALVDQGPRWDRLKVAGGARHHFSGMGDLLLMFEANTPEALQADDRHAQAKDWFATRVGLIVDEMLALAGSGAYLCVTRLELVDGPGRSDKKVQYGEGDFFQAVFTVEWGI